MGTKRWGENACAKCVINKEEVKQNRRLIVLKVNGQENKLPLLPPFP